MVPTLEVKAHIIIGPDPISFGLTHPCVSDVS